MHPPALELHNGAAMDKSERDSTRATAQHSLERDRGQGTNFTTAWLQMQRARLTQLKTAAADLEELIGIYEAELMRDQRSPSYAA
jgi:hypothetical protein